MPIPRDTGSTSVVHKLPRVDSIAHTIIDVVFAQPLDILLGRSLALQYSELYLLP